MLNPHKHSTPLQRDEITSLFTIKPIAKVISAVTLGVLMSTSVSSQAQEKARETQQKITTKSSDDSVAQLKTVKVTADAEEVSSSAQLDYLTKENASGALGDKTVLDTPFSITVIDSNEIVTRGAKSLGQIFVNDASVYAPTPSSSTDWWGTQIRGLPVRNYYVDDVPVLLNWAAISRQKLQRV